MAGIDLNEADKRIIGVLEEGRNTPANIAKRLDYSREYVSSRLKRLREHDVVARPDRGLYELVDDGSDGGEERDTGASERRQEAADDVEAALEGWRHGRDQNEREASREIAERATEWLRETTIDDVSRSDVPLTEFSKADPMGRSEDTLWTQVVRSSWQHAIERGYIEQPHSRAYNWTGE